MHVIWQSLSQGLLAIGRKRTPHQFKNIYENTEKYLIQMFCVNPNRSINFNFNFKSSMRRGLSLLINTLSSSESARVRDQGAPRPLTSRRKVLLSRLSRPAGRVSSRAAASPALSSPSCRHTSYTSPPHPAGARPQLACTNNPKFQSAMPWKRRAGRILNARCSGSSNSSSESL